MEKLNKSDILWIFAVKDNVVNEHYHKYYVSSTDPSIYSLYFITNYIMIKSNQVTRAYQFFQQSTFVTIAKIDRLKFSFEEFSWEMFKAWCYFLTRDEISKLTDLDWEKIVEEERATYDKK